ncbi:MAG TPA: protein kinase, partial [Dehalococcoidia bacterium]|nr:protein kinase [Dehalococcoidia bacterium]
QLLRERGRFALPDAIRILRSVCSALDYAHRQGLIHRDVKPQNILIGSDGTLKLTDFGIARALGGGSHSRTGEVYGTVQYIAPEQARGEPTTAASDIYSAGIVFYELVTGRVPYTGDSPIAVAMQHSQGPVPQFRTIDPRAPARLDAILARALAKDPRQRFASAGDFGRALTQFLQGGAADAPTQRVAVPDPPARPGRRGARYPSAPAPDYPAASPPGYPPARRRGTDWPFVLLGAFTSLVLLGLCLLGAFIVGR